MLKAQSKLHILFIIAMFCCRCGHSPPFTNQPEYRNDLHILRTDSIAYKPGPLSASAGNAAPSTDTSMVHLDGGVYLQGNEHYDDTIFDSSELPLREVTLSPFAMHKREITNADFFEVYTWAFEQGHIAINLQSQIINASGAQRILFELKPASFFSVVSFDSAAASFNIDNGYENKPVFSVTWYGAMAYACFLNMRNDLPQTVNLQNWSCDFTKAGYRLPTEAEWEYAARGNEPHNMFPGSRDTLTPSQAQIETDDFAAPGSFAPNGFGLFDMAGNAWEWCYDWIDFTPYGSPDSIRGEPVTNPIGPDTAFMKALRGGGYYDHYLSQRCAFRGAWTPDRSHMATGFRLVIGAFQISQICSIQQRK